jgi:nicotinamide mononucleotide transporter
VSWIELVATLAGALCVFLLVRQNIWNFPLGIIQVVLSGYVFFHQRLYSDVILQGFFVALNVYGWMHWLRGGVRDSPLPVTRLTRRAMAGWTTATLVLSLGWGTFAKFQLGAAAPYLDGFILVGSLVAQWLTARKRLESWWLWIAVDLVAVPLYASRGLYFLSALFAVFIVLCLVGLREWQASLVMPATATAGADPRSA